MTDDNSIGNKPDNLDDSIDRNEEENSDRISIVQWILLFGVLGALVYFSPMLFKLLPK